VKVEALVVFPTTHLTLKAEKVLEEASIRFRTIMKPRKISSDCGLAIRVGEGDLERSRDAILSAGLTPAGFYRETDRGWDCLFRLKEGRY
jgi:hypothetical protein